MFKEICISLVFAGIGTASFASSVDDLKQAESAYAVGNYSEAINGYKSALKLDSKSDQPLNDGSFISYDRWNGQKSIKAEQLLMAGSIKKAAETYHKDYLAYQKWLSRGSRNHVSSLATPPNGNNGRVAGFYTPPGSSFSVAF